MASRHPDNFDFLVDVNLPKMFSFFNYSNFTHIVDINPMMTDDEVWKYALKNNQVILTKDTDFYYKYMNSLVSPKVVYFQLGNTTLKNLHIYFEKNWDIIISYLDTYNLIYATKDQIIIIS
jgi:predicted nuclease of predicted toxin-antitoxin system